jgi:replicative DNA helicase
MDTSKIKPLPYSIEAEQFVLGSILIDGKGAETLKPEDFYQIEHQIIFQAIKNLWQKNIMPDILTVMNELGEKLKEVGGETYLVQLASAIPSTVNLPYYARIVKEKSILRQAFALGEKVQRLALQEDIEGIRQIGWQLSGLYVEEAEKPFGETLTEEDYQRLAESKRWTSENLPKLTYYVPFMRGENVYIAGRTSTGKTQIALNLALSFLFQGAKIGYLSMELGREQLLLRLINWEFGDELSRLSRGTPLANINLKDKKWWDAGMAIIKQDAFRNFYFVEEYSDLADIEGWIETHNFDVVFIDYIQLIRTRKGGNRNEEMEHIARELRRLSKKRCIVVLSQFNRAKEEDETEIDLSRLRDSGALEQTATSIILIRRDRDEIDKFYYAVAKNQTLGVLSNGWKRMELTPSGKFKEE